jgi:hypothetical protein
VFCYTNRKGTTYYLHSAKTRGGALRYTLKTTPEGATKDLPPGYEVVESVNGQASVRQIRPRLISAEEETLVQAELKRQNLPRYRTEVKGKILTVFEPHSDPDEVAGRFSSILFDLPGRLGKNLEAQVRQTLGDAAIDQYIRNKQQEFSKSIEQEMHYDPVLRFRLVDEERRMFAVDRMTYSGEGGWRPLWTMSRAPLEQAVKQYVPHLGKDSFFELI